MTGLLLGIGIPIVLLLAMVAVLARRGLQMRRLLAEGVETEGRVIEQVSHTARTYQAQKRIRYEYIDASGKHHRHLSLVSDETWDAHPRGTRIAVVYARSRPSVSAPLALVEQARKAMKSS
ncbi:DUF3592 domain-containing protein [Marilutibacter maris]|uniref:DUF3592 domain-containing protein n=1 Tax=Marilutibacter maris TaxID=1605891 RepID=UPI000DAA0899|nr:DUF3592 domain-containing protein [Lysobacter maris]